MYRRLGPDAEAFVAKDTLPNDRRPKASFRAHSTAEMLSLCSQPRPKGSARDPFGKLA